MNNEQTVQPNKVKEPGLRDWKRRLREAVSLANSTEERISPWHKPLSQRTELDRTVHALYNMYKDAINSIGSGKGTIGYLEATKLQVYITSRYLRQLERLERRLTRQA
jgi:hypothetical protein